MIKVVINERYGGFGLSDQAVKWLEERGIRFEDEYDRGSNIPRHHPLLVECVEELGDKASSDYATLTIKTISGHLYQINEYDGWESVLTPDKQVWIDANQLLYDNASSVS